MYSGKPPSGLRESGIGMAVGTGGGRGVGGGGGEKLILRRNFVDITVIPRQKST